MYSKSFNLPKRRSDDRLSSHQLLAQPTFATKSVKKHVGSTCGGRTDILAVLNVRYLIAFRSLSSRLALLDLQLILRMRRFALDCWLRYSSLVSMRSTRPSSFACKASQ